MARGGDHREVPPSPAAPSTKRKKNSHHHHHHQSKKKRRLIISESETHTRFETQQTLTINSCSTIASTSYAHVSRHTTTRTDTSEARHRIKSKRKPENHRSWTYSHRDFSNHKEKIVLVSYNILGVENASKHPDLYINISPKYLDWDYRKRLIRKEVRKYDPGIICFQEVDRFDDLDNILRKDGFSGVYQGRTGDACDGCAMFWKDDLFTLLHEENIEFQRHGLRNNVAQLCVLKMNSTRSSISPVSDVISSRSLLVGNIHVLFNPNRGDIKLGQLRLFLEKANQLSQDWGNIPVVIAGDLNSMPQSAIYQFLSSSELDIQLHDRKRMSGQICPIEYRTSRFHSRDRARPIRSSMYWWSDEELSIATGTRERILKHHLKLSSAYVGVPGSSRTRDHSGEPLATSYHSKFFGTVDYIWHSLELVPVRVLETLSVDSLRKDGGLPNKRWGSDHLALVCELAFANDSIGV